MGMLLMIILCLGILLYFAVRKQKEWLLNIVMRSILGAIAIYFINMGFDFLGISVAVGINAITILTCGILGFPGLLAIYGIGFYQLL